MGKTTLETPVNGSSVLQIKGMNAQRHGQNQHRLQKELRLESVKGSLLATGNPGLKKDYHTVAAV